MRLQVAIDGKKYDVEVEITEDDTNPRAYPAYAPLPSGASTPAAPKAATPQPALMPAADMETVADESKVCRSPIAGVVIRSQVQAGQQIQPDDLLLVLEAMKMETNVTAPVAGKIKSIRVQAGDPVQIGQVLVEFE